MAAVRSQHRAPYPRTWKGWARARARADGGASRGDFANLEETAGRGHADVRPARPRALAKVEPDGKFVAGIIRASRPGRVRRCGRAPPQAKRPPRHGRARAAFGAADFRDSCLQRVPRALARPARFRCLLHLAVRALFLSPLVRPGPRTIPRPSESDS